MITIHHSPEDVAQALGGQITDTSWSSPVELTAHFDYSDAVEFSASFEFGRWVVELDYDSLSQEQKQAIDALIATEN